MKSHEDTFRKAAILVASLTPQAADRLLDLFPEDQAQRLRQLMVDLGEVDPAEERQVLEEFLRVGPLVPQPQPSGIELDDRLARLLARAPEPPDEEADSLRGQAQPFRALRDAEANKLARVLAGARPQPIALVLSHLPPQQAGAVLVRLDSVQQVDVIRRLVDLEETNPEILRDVERALEARLSQQVRMQRRRVAGLKAVAGILQASPGEVGTQILENLAARDRDLAEKLGPEPVAFEDLLGADDRAWAAILGAAEPEVVLLALIGAPQRWIDRVVRNLPPLEAEELQRQLDEPGPIRLRDVEEARGRLAELARQLAVAGRIELPPAVPHLALSPAA